MSDQVWAGVFAFLTVALIAARDLYRERKIRKDHIEDRQMDAEDRRVVAAALVEEAGRVAHDLDVKNAADRRMIADQLAEKTERIAVETRATARAMAAQLTEELVRKTDLVASELTATTLWQAEQVAKTLKETTAAQTEHLKDVVVKAVKENGNGTKN